MRWPDVQLLSSYLKHSRDSSQYVLDGGLLLESSNVGIVDAPYIDLARAVQRIYHAINDN